MQLFTLKGIIKSFVDSMGLKVNYQKSFIVPINIDEDKALHLGNTIGYQVKQMPFIYLGVPLGITRPTVEDFYRCFLHRQITGCPRWTHEQTSTQEIYPGSGPSLKVMALRLAR
jgi:hypothetical protein